MVKEISNIVDSILPAISIASLTASAFMGRKFGLAIGYDFSSRIASLFGKQHIAEEYNKTSSDYWTLAKKDAFRDLTAAAGFFTLGIASNYASKALLAREPKEEPGWCDNIPVLNTICEYKKSAAGVIGLGSIGSAVLFKDNIRQQLITIRNGLSLRIGTGNRSKAALPWIRSIRNKLNFCIKFIEPESPVVDLSKPIRWPKRDYNG